MRTSKDTEQSEGLDADHYADHYAYRVSWSPEDGEWVATVAEHPHLSCLEQTPETALAGLRALVASVVTDMLADGETPPRALADKTYSGRFNLRVPPELHRQLVIDAAAQGVSLNQLAVSRLA